MKNNKEPQLSDPISIHWQKFFDQGKEIATLPINEWKPVHLIAYWCKLYERQYKRSFTFKFKASPSKSYEIYRLRELATNISSDPLILKHYIDWIFEYKVVQKKKRITSLAILCDANYINEYKEKFLCMSDKPIDRSTAIPPNFAKIIQDHNQPFTTYGDLAFARQSGDRI